VPVILDTRPEPCTVPYCPVSAPTKDVTTPFFPTINSKVEVVIVNGTNSLYFVLSNNSNCKFIPA